VPQQSQR